MISVRRTGLVVFSSRMASVFTGLAFLLLMTRTLSPPQFGEWEVILDVVTFSSYPAGFLVFWATRDIARGRLLGKTALVMNLLLSSVGMVLFVLFLTLVSGDLGADYATLLLAVLLVPIGYWNQAANAIVQGHNPIILGYSGILSEASKLLVAVPALLLFHAGLDGVILAIIAANFTQAAFSTYLAWDASELPFDPVRAKRWASLAWLPSLTTLPYVLGVADTFVAFLASGHATLIGEYQAAFAVATIAGYSYYLASALYPLLLKGGSGEVTSASLDLLLLFGIPMAVGAAALAKPILTVLRHSYVGSSTGALVILAFSALVTSISWVLDQTLMGREKVDADASATFRQYVHSNLFFVSVVDIATAVAYLSAVYLVVAAAEAASTPAALILDEWALAQLVVFTLFAAIKIRRASRAKGALVVRSSLVHYIVGGGLMGAFLATGSSLLDYSLNTYAFGVEAIGIGVIGVAIYGAFLFATDGNFRRLFRSVMRPILG